MTDKKKILIIDDEEDVCYLTKLNLESTGKFDVSTANSGADGLIRAKGEHFDLVITDYKMPGMDGMEVLETLKAMKPYHPVVLFSIYYDDGTTMTEAIKKKADGLLSKPIDKDQLIKTIEKLLG